MTGNFTKAYVEHSANALARALVEARERVAANMVANGLSPDDGWAIAERKTAETLMNLQPGAWIYEFWPLKDDGAARADLGVRLKVEL